MAWQSHPALIVFYGGIFVILALTVYTVNYIRKRGRSRLPVALLVMLVFEVFWTAGAIVKVGTLDLSTAFLAYRIETFGTALSVASFVVLVIIYTDRDRPINPLVGLFLVAGPVMLIGGMLVDGRELLFVDPRFVPASGWQAFEHDFGPLFEIYQTWILVTVLGTVVVLAVDLIRKPRHRKPLAMLFVAGALPLVLATLKILDIYPPGGQGVNLTPGANAISLALVSIAVYVYRLHELTPVAKDRAIETMREGYLVVDREDRIRDVNPAGATVLGIDSARESIGTPVTDVFPAYDRFEGSDRLEVTTDDRVLEATRSALGDRNRTGWLVILHDVTERKHREERIEQESQSKEAVLSLLSEFSTRGEIETVVCRLLTESHGYDCAFVARAGIESSEGASALSLEAHAGDDRGYLAAIAEDGTDGTDGTDDQRFEGTTTKEAYAGDRLSDVTQSDEGIEPPAIEDYGFETALSVPITYAGVTYGVVTVLDGSASGSGSGSESVPIDETLVETFASAIASKTHTLDQRDALLTDAVTQLELTITDEDYYLVDLARSGILPEDAAVEVFERDGGETQLLKVDGDGPSSREDGGSAPSRSRLEETATSVTAIQDVAALSDDEETLFKLAVDGPTVGTILSRHGGVVQSTRVEYRGARIVAEFPRRSDVTAAIQDLQQHWDDLRIISKQVVSVEESETTPLDVLTDKQREAIQIAYFAGFFDRPQGATANEVADALDVSRSTFLQHVRTAEQKLLAQLLEDGPNDDRRS